MYVYMNVNTETFLILKQLIVFRPKIALFFYLCRKKSDGRIKQSGN